MLVAPAEIPVKPDPSPVNDVAVKVPLIFKVAALKSPSISGVSVSELAITSLLEAVE